MWAREDTGDTNPKLLVNGYRLVSLSQWSPAPLSLVSNEQETHQCEPLSLETKKSCRNFDLRAGRSWRGCRDRWCPSSCPSTLLPFFAHSPTRSPLWMRLRDHCWHPQCHSHHHSQVIMSTPPARPAQQGKEIPVTGKLPDDQTHLGSWTHLSEAVSHIPQAELQSFNSFCMTRFFGKNIVPIWSNQYG